MKTSSSFFLLAILLTSSVLSIATRPEPFEQSLQGKPTNPNNKADGNGDGTGTGEFPGSGFGIPGFENGWGNGIVGGGYGAGFGGPNGGYSRGGVMRSSMVCKVKGPCYNKKLTCPAKCFSSFSRSGKGYGGGGGGGGCTMDCKKKCTAYC